MPDDLIRTTTNGEVKGEKRINSLALSESYLAFHAIPYAEPPIENKRFMHPIPHSNWDNIYDASTSDHKDKCCPQVRLIHNNLGRTVTFLLDFLGYEISNHPIILFYTKLAFWRRCDSK